MSITLENKQGLIAGDGILPIRMAQYAKENGFEVVCISLAHDNVRELKKYCSKVYNCHPGEVNKIESILKEEQIKQMTFLGKVCSYQKTHFAPVSYGQKFSYFLLQTI